MSAITLYNTRRRALGPFTPIKPNEVGLYTCGPTVYQYAHLGNLRSYVFADTLRRALEYSGFAVNHVMNITDVGHLTGDVDEGEDKVEQAAKQEGKTAWEIASFYTDAFLEDIARLNIAKPHIIAKATAHIPEQISLIQQLEAKGLTYRIDDGIYFDTSRLTQYGPLTGQPIDELQAGARVEPNPQKRHPHDFALWKFSNPSDRNTPPDGGVKEERPRRQMEWESPWGVGFPGWHVECSAMSVKYLGQPFDIHTGGVDHIFPHHANEIAQSESATGQPLANTWLHGEFMTVDGAKMSKSLGNTYTLQEVIDRGHDPLAFRYLQLQTHYRKPLNFTWESLAAADHGLRNLRTLARDLPASSAETEALEPTLEEEFRTLIGHDLGVPQALALLWDVLKSDREPTQKTVAIQHWDQVFGLDLAAHLGQSDDIPAEVSELVRRREQARTAGEYAQADQLRAKIEMLGYSVRDAATGPTVQRSEHPTEL